jgi:hypothetical protein
MAKLQQNSALSAGSSPPKLPATSLSCLTPPAGGRYYNTPNFIFSSRWAGSLDPSEAENYAVKDCILAWRQVGKFNWELYREYASIYNGSLMTGLLRSPSSTLNNTYVTRFPVSNLFKKNSSVSGRSVCYLMSACGMLAGPKAQRLCMHTTVVCTAAVHKNSLAW